MIVRSREILKDGPSQNAIRACLQEHLSHVQRLEMLHRYYCGEHNIALRERAGGMPNNRLSHGFPRYISTVAAGYLLGQPVEYAVAGARQEALDAVLEAYGRCCVDSVDAELARMASIFGKGVELVFADEEARPRCASIDPRRAFVVYDDTVEGRPLFGVHLHPLLKEDGAEKGWSIEVYTDSERLSYESGSPGDVLRLVGKKPHFFGAVPMIEYWNGEDEHGDFEGVISLIDAYDLLQSDRMNDKQQFVDALLLLYGCTMETDEQGRSPGRQLREDKVLVLPDADARVEWLCKQLNEADTEVLRGAISSDVHKLCMVPDLSDEHFASNSSGVAMRYKLLGLEQLTKIKERWFREGLRQRMERFSEFLSLKGAPRLNANEVELRFRRSLPMDGLAQAQTISALRGVLPDDELAHRAARVDG